MKVTRWTPMCPRACLTYYKRPLRLVLCYKKDWATLLHVSYCYLLLVTNCLTIKLSVTTIFSTCREYIAENRLSFPSAPRWVWHSYLSKGQRLIPYLVGHQGGCRPDAGWRSSVRGAISTPSAPSWGLARLCRPALRPWRRGRWQTLGCPSAARVAPITPGGERQGVV